MLFLELHLSYVTLQYKLYHRLRESFSLEKTFLTSVLEKRVIKNAK